MDLHRLRVVGFDTLENAEKGKNKNIAEHEESRKEDNVIDDDKYYETNELDDASDKKCAQDNVVSSGSSKKSNFMNRKSKSEIFRIPSRNKLQNRDLKVNSSFEDLPKQLTHLNKKKKTLKLFNRRSTADQGDLRKKLETSKFHEDVRFLFTRETPSFIRYSKKRAKYDWPKLGHDQKYSNDLYGFKKNNRCFDPYLYQMSCNYLNIDKFPLKKLRKGFRRKVKTNTQPSKDCSCKHHAMRVLNSAVISSDRGDVPSIYYNLSKVHSHARRHRRKRDVSFHRNEGWAKESSYNDKLKDQNVAVSPSSLAPLKRCYCDACVGSSKVEITSRPHRRPPVVYRDATSSHHKPPSKQRPKPSPKQSPASHNMPSSQDSSLSQNKLILEDTPGSSSPKNASHLYKPQFVVCKGRKNKKKARKSSILNNQRKEVFRGFFQNIAAFHTKSRISGKNCIKYVFFGLLIVVWSPCLLAVILAWVVMCPIRLTNMLANDKSRKTFAFWKSFMHRFRKKDAGSDYGRMCCDHCSRQNHKSFMSSVASWYARAAGTVLTSFNALISMLKIKKARSCGSSFMTSTHPNPRKRYTLYYADNRGWMMKPTRRSNYNRSSTRVVQSMRCEFRPKFWPKSKTNPDAQMESACSNIPVQCPVHGNKCAKVKALRRKMLSPAGDAGQMLSESSPSCVCEASLKRSKSRQRSAMLMPETSPRYDPGQKVNIPSMKFNPSYGKASTSQNYQPMNTIPTQLNFNKKNEMLNNFYPKYQSRWKSGTLPFGVMFDCPCGTKHPTISNREVYQTHMFGLAGKRLNFCVKHTPSSKSKCSRQESIKPRIALNCPCGMEINDLKNVGNRKTKETTKSKQIKMQSKDIQLKQKRSTTKRIALNCPCGDEPNMTGMKSRGIRATNLENKAQKNTHLKKHHHQIRTRNRGISAELSQSALTRQAKTSTIEINKTDKTQSISEQTFSQMLKYLVDRKQGTSKHSLKQKKTELIDRSQNVSKDSILKKKSDLIDRAQSVSKLGIFHKKTELIDKSQNVSRHSFGQQKNELIDRSLNASKTSIDQNNTHLIDRSQNVSKHSFSQNKKDLIDRSQNISKNTLNVDQVNASMGSAKGATVECGCWAKTESRASDEKRMTQTSIIDRLFKSKSNISQKLSIGKASRDDCPCVAITQQTEEIRPDPVVHKTAVDCACGPEMQPSSTAAKNTTLHLAQAPKEQTEKAAQCDCDMKLTKDNKKTDRQSLILKKGIDCECNTETQSLTPFCPCPVSTHPERAINRETITNKSSKQQASASEKQFTTEKADKSFHKPSTIQKEKPSLKQSVPYKLAIDCGCETDKQLITAADLQPRVTQMGVKCTCRESVLAEKSKSNKGSVICECWPEKKQSATNKETIPAKQAKLSKEKVDCSCETEAQSSTIKTDKRTLCGAKCTCRESVLAEKSKSNKGSVICECWPEKKQSATNKETIPAKQAKLSKEKVDCSCETEAQSSTIKIDKRTLCGAKCTCRESVLAEKSKSNKGTVTCGCIPEKKQSATNKETIPAKQAKLSKEKVDCSCETEAQSSTIKTDKRTLGGAKCTCRESVLAEKSKSNKGSVICECWPEKKQSATNKETIPAKQSKLSKEKVDCSCETEAQSSTIKIDKRTLCGAKCTCRESVLAEKSKSNKGTVTCGCIPEKKQSATNKETIPAKQAKLSKEKVDCSCETEAQSSTIQTDKRTLCGAKCTCRESVLAEKSKSNKGTVTCGCITEKKQSATNKETVPAKQANLSKGKVDCSCETEAQSSTIKTDKRTLCGAKCTCRESVLAEKSKSKKGSVICECWPEKKQSATNKETIPAKQAKLSKEKVDCSCETEAQSSTIKTDKRTLGGAKCTCRESVLAEKSKSTKGSVTCGCMPEKKQSATNKETIPTKQAKLSKEKVECGCGTDKTSVTFRDTVPKEQVKPSKLMIDCGCGTDDQPKSLTEETQTILKGSNLSSPQISQTISSEAPSKIDIALNCPCGSSHQLSTKYTDLNTISKKTSISSSHLSQKTVSVKQGPGYKMVINCPCPASPEPSTHDRETLTSKETILVQKPSKQTMASQLPSTDKASGTGIIAAPVSLPAKTMNCACGPDPSAGDIKLLDGFSGIPKQENKHSKLNPKGRYGMAPDCACGTNNADMGSLHTQKSFPKSKTENTVIDFRHSQIVNNFKSAVFPYGVAQNCKCANKPLIHYKTDSKKILQSEPRRQEISSHKLLSKKDSSQRPHQKSSADKDKNSTQVKPLAEQKHPSSVQVAKTPNKQSKSDKNQKNAVGRKKTYETSLTPHPLSKVTNDSQSQTLQKQPSLYGKAFDCPCDSIGELSSQPPRTSSLGVADKRLTISNKNKSTDISSTKKVLTKNLKSTQTPRITLQKQAPEVEMATDCECVSDDDEKVKKASESDTKSSSADQKSSVVAAQPLKSDSSDVGSTQCECSSKMDAIQEQEPKNYQSIKNDIKSLRDLSTASAENPTTPPQLLKSLSPVFGVSPDCTCSKKLKMNKSRLKVPFPFGSQKASQTRSTQMTKKRSDLQRRIAKKSTLTEEAKQATLLKYPRKTSLTKISSNEEKKPRDTSQMFNKLKQSFIKKSKDQTLDNIPDDIPDTLKRNSNFPSKPSFDKQPSSRNIKETQTKPLWLGRPCFCPPELSRSTSNKKRTIDYTGKTKKQLSKRDREKTKSYQSEKSNSYQSERSQPEISKVSSVKSSRIRCLEERLSSLRRRISSLQRLPHCSCDKTTNRSSLVGKSRPFCCCSISDKTNKKKIFSPVVTSSHRISQTSLNHTECVCPAGDHKVPVVTRSHLFKSVVVNKSQMEKGQPQIPKQKLSIPHSSQKMLLCPDQVMPNSSTHDKKKLKQDKIKKKSQKTFKPNYKSSKGPCFHSECACTSVENPLSANFPPSTITYASSRLSRLVMKLHCKLFSRKECPQTNISQPATRFLSPSSQCSVSRQSKISHLSTIPVSVQKTSSLHTRKSTLEYNSPISFKQNSQFLRKSSHPSFSLTSNSRFRCPVHKDLSKCPSGSTTRHNCEPSKLDKPCTCSIKDAISQQSRQSIVSNVSCRKCFSHDVPSLQLSSIKSSKQTPKSLVSQYYPRLSQRSINQRSKTSHYSSTVFPLTPIKCNCSNDKISCAQHDNISGHGLKTSSAKKSHSKSSKRVENKLDKDYHRPSHSHQTNSNPYSDSIRDLPQNSQKPISRRLKSQQTTKTPHLSSTDKLERLPSTRAKHKFLDSVSHAHLSCRTNQTSKDTSLSQHTKSKPFSEKLKHFSDKLSRRSHKNEKSSLIISSECYCDQISGRTSQLSHKNGKNVQSSPPLIPGGCYCDEISQNVSQLSNINEKNVKSPLLISGECYCDHISENISQPSYKSAPRSERQYIISREGSHYPCHACLENEGKTGVLHHIASQQAKVPEPAVSKLNVATSFSTFNQSQHSQLTEKVNNLEVTQQPYEQKNIDSQNQVLHYSNNQPVQRYPLHPFIPIPILPGKCTCAENQQFKSDNTQNMKDEFLNQQINSVPTPSVHRLPESYSAEKLRLLSNKLLPHHKATMKTEDPPTPSENNQPSELIRHFPHKSTLDTREQPANQQTEFSKPTLSGKSTSQNQPAIKEPGKSKQQLLELEPNPAIAIIPGVCKCSRSQSEYSKLQQNLQHLPSQQTKMTETTSSIHSFHPRQTENKQRLFDQVSVNSRKSAIKNVEPVEPNISLSQKPTISSNTPHTSSSPIQSNKQRLSSDLESPFQQNSSIVDDEEQRKISQNHQSEQTKIPQKSPHRQQIKPRRIIPGMCTCSISKDRIPPAIVQNQLQKSSESKFQPQILNHHFSQPHIIPLQPSHIHRIKQPQSFAKKKRNSCKIGQTENIHPSRCQHITIQRSEVSHNKPGSLRFKLPVICPNVYDDDCTGNLKCELVASPNKTSRHVLSSTTPVDKPPGLLQQHSTGQVHPVRKRSSDSGKHTKPANAQQYPVGQPNMPPPQPDFNRVAMRYPGHNPKPEHIPSPANYYFPPPAAGVPPPNYARLPCFINPLNNCGPKSSGDEQSLRRAYKRRPIRFTPPKDQEKIPKTKPSKPLKKKAEVKKKQKKKKGGGNKISQFFNCVREVVVDADKGAWPIAVSCRPLYIHAMRRRPCFWVYECCPSLYPMFLSCYKFQENICQMFMYVLSICFWCPLIICAYFCCDLMCGSSN